MANKFARANGDFNNASIWSLSATGLSATTVPTIGDNASANTYTIQITGNVACDNITNGTAYGGTAGGTFNLGNASQLTSIIRQGGLATACLTLSGSNSSTVIGTVIGGGFGGGSVQFTGSSLSIIGTIEGQTGGNVGAVINAGTGNLNMTGTVYGGDSYGANRGLGLQNTSTGQVNVIGQTIGRTFAAVDSSTAGTITVQGNMIADSRGGAAITSSNAAANVRVSGNIINAPNGIAAVYAASCRIDPVPTNTYIKYAKNGTGVGDDAYAYHYTSDALSAFSLPPASAVRLNTTYSNGTLSGTCAMPPQSAVSFGALVDNTTGTAALTSNNLWDVATTSLTASNSLGTSLKNVATTEAVGRLIASF